MGRKLLFIFIIATEYIHFIFGIIAIIVGLFVGGLFLWEWQDRQEIILRNKVLAQQEVVEKFNIMFNKFPKDERVRDALLDEQKRLIDCKSEYAIMRERWLGKTFLGNRPLLDNK